MRGGTEKPWDLSTNDGASKCDAAPENTIILPAASESLTRCLLPAVLDIKTSGFSGIFSRKMLCLSGLSLALVLSLYPGSSEALKEGECEDIETALVKTCKDAKGKENRFCYYIGATSDAATKIVNEVSKPLSYHAPVEKICEKLKKKDSQICELRYDKQLDLTSVDLKKLKVKDLKKILEEWDETCKGCAEKSDFIRKITELMPKHAPAAAQARTDL
ncbi:hypothetical protein F7725_016322 [Dissostichus mawsoni]|uniref:Mesencephalic astrocyte-derived neurotrophic factor n=1 Tax=Dissostichus mawsoni TaxID=36200 RepID=A0A7J5Z3F5_DISMA|nr:hypothetical protein F7725_016322 [Dissostichus mawsoni]